MRRVQEHVARGQARLAEHRFIRTLGRNLPFEQVVRFVPHVSFFVFVFQDLMKMTGERASDPRLRDLLLHHCEEESGHERWFLEDVARLAGAAPNLATVFGAPHAPTREASYRLAAQVVGAADDIERLSLIFTLEAAGDACFGAAQAYFERVGVTGLAYFAGPHRDAEQGHAVFAKEMRAFVDALVLDDHAYARACRAVDDTYAAIRVMLDGLANVVEPSAT